MMIIITLIIPEVCGYLSAEYLKLTDDEPKEVGHSKKMEVSEQAVDGKYAKKNLHDSNNKASRLKGTVNVQKNYEMHQPSNYNNRLG